MPSTNQLGSLMLTAIERSQLVLILPVQSKKMGFFLVVQGREIYTVPATTTKTSS